jgi:hypothetical protein
MTMKKILTILFALTFAGILWAQPPVEWEGNPLTHDGTGTGTFWMTPNMWWSLSPDFEATANRYRMNRLDVPQITDSGGDNYDNVAGTLSFSLTDVVVTEDTDIILLMVSAPDPPATVMWDVTSPQPFSQVSWDVAAGVGLYRLSSPTVDTADIIATFPNPQIVIELVYVMVRGVSSGAITAPLGANPINAETHSSISPGVSVVGGLTVDFLLIGAMGAAHNAIGQEMVTEIGGAGSRMIYVSAKEAFWNMSIQDPATYGETNMSWSFPSTSGFHVGVTLDPRLETGTWTGWELGFGEIAFPEVERVDATTWAASTAYALGDRVVGTATYPLRHFEATTAQGLLVQPSRPGTRLSARRPLTGA